MPEPLAKPKVPLDRLTCLSGDPVRSELLGPEPGATPDPPSDREADDRELEDRLSPDGMLTGPLTPEACASYLRDRGVRS